MNLTKDEILLKSEKVMYPKDVRLIQFYSDFIAYDDDFILLDYNVDKVSKHFEVIIWKMKYDSKLNKYYVDIYFRLDDEE